MPWYALHVASNTERQVADRLNQAEIESYYPFVAVQSKDGRRELQKKFFPGYVFARFELANRTPVIRIPQVIQILGMGGHRAVEIPNSEIEAVRIMVQSAVASLSQCPYVADGETITITRGPLQGLEGFVVRTKGHARVVCSIATLGRSMSAEVNIRDIEPRRVIPFPVKPAQAVGSAGTRRLPAARTAAQPPATERNPRTLSRKVAA